MNQYREQETGHTAGAMPGTGLFFVVNPASHSGKGMKLWKRVKGLLSDQGISHEVRFSKKQGDIARIVRTLTSSLPKGQERTLVILGGDGTVNEALQGLVHPERVRLGYIPTGSGNDFARGLGIPSDVTACMKAILSPSAFAMADVGVSRTSEGKRHFLVSSGIGYDADICLGVMKTPLKKILNRLHLGKLTYIFVALKLLWDYRCCPVSVRIDKKEIYRLPRFYFLAGMNMKQEGGGVKFCPQARYCIFHKSGHIL